MGDGVIGDRYRLIDRLDSGGHSEVWRAQDENLNRPVAIKILKSDYVKEEGFADRFVSEAKAGAGLTHPNIVDVYDWGRQDDQYYVVMEYISGRTLRQVLDEEGPLVPDRAAHIALDLASALQYAHDAGITHRNLRPQHVLIADDGQIKLTDFGVTRRPETASGETAVIDGDARYASPEQAQGKPTGAATDVYALGVILFQMLTGRVPFVGDTPVEIAMKHIGEEPVAPRTLNAAIPADLEAIVLKAMAKDPAHRYQSAREMAEDLRKVTTEGRPVAVKKSRAGVWAAVVIILVVLLLFASAAAAVLSRQAPTAIVPDVAGMPSAEASQTLMQVKLVPEAVESASPTVAAGAVISEDPPAGRQVRQGSVVTITVSTGPLKTPLANYVGLPLSQALDEIVAKGMVVGRIDRKPNNAFPADTVYAQLPAAGRPVAPGTKVDLSVSTGRVRVAVPDVIGLDREDATAKLADVGLDVDVLERFSSSTRGIVFDQSPKEGTRVPPGAAVTIYVSRGKQTATVPDVVGESESAARTTLESQGFGVAITSTVVTDTAQVGVVQSEDPPAGTVVPAGSQVKIVVGRSG